MNGTPPTGQVPNGGPRKFIQRHQTSDPLVRPKKRPQRAPLKKPAGTATNRNAPTSGHSLDNKASSPASRASPAKPSPSSTAAAAKNNNNGFSGPPPKGEYYDYDLVTTKKALLEGLRFHVARFASKKNVNPLNTDEFTRPVRLQRRDPRAPPTGGAGSKSAEPEDAPMTKEDLMDEKERERQEALKAEKEAQKQADLEQIAPRAHQPAAASSKKHSTFNKKTTQVYDHDQTPEARKRSQVRYEEALPWHLEDFDNKNAWVGNYESALSDMYVGLIGSPNKFRMVPMERWYKFTPKNHFKTLTIEEAESRMNKPVKEPRWLMEKRNAEGQKKLQDEANRRGGRSLFIGKWENERVSGTSRRVKADPDADDIDYEKVVSDDEEPPLMEGEEEVAKEAEKRIKKDQLQANVFDLKDEKEYEREDDEDKKQQELAKKLGKGVKKALIAREKNYIYDTDSDFDPDDEESDEEASDKDKEKNKDDEKKKADEKADPKAKGKDATGKVSSGATTKGTNTPSGRPKNTEPLKKHGASLKRPGSPDLSEASGTDSNKKQKKKHQRSSSHIPGSPMSATSGGDVERKPTTIKLSVPREKLNEISSSTPNPAKRNRDKMGAGSGSDGEATGGEMSEGSGQAKQKKKKIKLHLKGPSPDGTPRGSRAGSPNVITTNTARSTTGGSGDGSRAGSPSAAGSPQPGLKPLTDEEIVAALVPEGCTIPELILALGRDRVNLGKDSFTSRIRVLAYMGPGKLLYPRTAETNAKEATDAAEQAQVEKDAAARKAAKAAAKAEKAAAKAKEAAVA